MTTRPLTVGTAGHVDHGKTALVRALTGRETDRIPEERRRGISIELGFAPLDLGARTVSLIDVPGHERFVRTMIAGAGGIDLYLLVVDAHEGVRAQTREHLAVLGALGVRRGVCAITKCDAADAEARKRATQQVAQLLPEAAVIETSAIVGTGLPELRAALAEVAEEVDRSRDRPEAESEADPVLHIDRAFSLPGHGTIVTGTLQSGALRSGESIRLLPADREVRIRSLQVHDQPVEIAQPRQRVAVNLAGVKRSDVRRGDVLSGFDAPLEPSYRLDVDLEPPALAELTERVQVHHGTREAPARLVALGEPGLAQLRLESPLIALSRDRVVIRRLAPPDTLGGAEVLDAKPRRHGAGAASARLDLIQHGSPADILRAALDECPGDVPADPSDWGPGSLLGAAHRWHGESEWQEAIALLVESGDAIQAGSALLLRPQRGQQAIAAAPPASEPSREAIAALELLRTDEAMPRAPIALAEALDTTGADAEKLLGELLGAGLVATLKPGIYYPVKTLETLRTRTIAMLKERGPVSVAELRDTFGITRKYAQALLEHLDSTHVTIRRDDRHLLRRAYRD